MTEAMPMTALDLRAWRDRVGLRTQKAAADALGMSHRQYQRLENEASPIPRAIALACAAIALGIRDYSGGELRPGIIEGGAQAGEADSAQTKGEHDG